jgi:hypothetical protein
VIDEDFSIADCDRYAITVNSSTSLKSPMIPKNELVRFQFLEMFIRTAIMKYFEKDEEVNSKADAI